MSELIKTEKKRQDREEAEKAAAEKRKLAEEERIPAYEAMRKAEELKIDYYKKIDTFPFFIFNSDTITLL